MNQERRGAIFVHPSLGKLRVCNIYEKIYKPFSARGVARGTFLTGKAALEQLALHISAISRRVLQLVSHAEMIRWGERAIVHLIVVTRLACRNDEA